MSIPITEQAHRVLLLDNYTGIADSSEGYILTQMGDKAVTVSGALANTVQIEIEGAGGWSPIDGGEFTAIGSRTLIGIGKGQKIRATLTGSEDGLYVEITK